jgi:hypothetical protein
MGFTRYSAAVVPTLRKVREERGTHNCDTFGKAGPPAIEAIFIEGR